MAIKRNHFKIKLRQDGKYIKATIFSGNEGEILANCGELTLRVGEWRLFEVLLILGYESKSYIKRHCYLTIDGHDDIKGKEKAPND